jgi:hypothetical protein
MASRNNKKKGKKQKTKQILASSASSNPSSSESLVIFASKAKISPSSHNTTSWLPCKYTGYVRKETMLPHGQGRCTRAIDGATYVGEFENGIPHGKGEATYADKGKYTGDFVEGRQHGHGKYSNIEEGVFFEGTFVNGRLNGWAIWKDTPKNKTYEGYFKDGKAEGYGKNVCQKSFIAVPYEIIYEGVYRDGALFDGLKITHVENMGTTHETMKKGRFLYWERIHDTSLKLEGGYVEQGETLTPKTTKATHPNGDVYQGENFVDIALSGKGTLTKSDGTVFEALDWNPGEFPKLGILTDTDGSIYEGEVRWDQATDTIQCHGYGKRTTTQGYYEGEWYKNRCRGKGKTVWLDGSSYEGYAKHGVPHGLGTWRRADGTIKHQGLFRNGKPYHGRGPERRFSS